MLNFYRFSTLKSILEYLGPLNRALQDIVSRSNPLRWTHRTREPICQNLGKISCISYQYFTLRETHWGYSGPKNQLMSEMLYLHQTFTDCVSNANKYPQFHLFLCQMSLQVMEGYQI